MEDEAREGFDRFMGEYVRDVRELWDAYGNRPEGDAETYRWVVEDVLGHWDDDFRHSRDLVAGIDDYGEGAVIRAVVDAACDALG